MHLTSKQKRRERRKERARAYISACKKREEQIISENSKPSIFRSIAAQVLNACQCK